MALQAAGAEETRLLDRIHGIERERMELLASIGSIHVNEQTNQNAVNSASSSDAVPVVSDDEVDVIGLWKEESDVLTGVIAEKEYELKRLKEQTGSRIAFLEARNAELEKQLQRRPADPVLDGHGSLDKVQNLITAKLQADVELSKAVSERATLQERLIRAEASVDELETALYDIVAPNNARSQEARRREQAAADEFCENVSRFVTRFAVHVDGLHSAVSEASLGIVRQHAAIEARFKADLELERVHLKGDVEKHKTEAAAMQRTLEELLQQHEKEHQTLKSTLQQREQEATTIKHELEKTRGQLEKSRNELDTSKSELDKSQSELEKSRTEVRDVDFFRWNECSIQDLLAELQSSMKDIRLVKDICMGIVILAGRGEGPREQIGVGGCELLLKVAKAHEQSRDAVVLVLAALSAVCQDQEENSRRFGDLGGVEAVLGFMRFHALDAGVQEQGFTCLSELAGTDTNREKVLKNGGLEKVIQAMAKHSNVGRVQEAGSAALVQLVQFLTKRSMSFDEMSCISTAVTAMQLHAAGAGVQGHCLKLLAALAASSEKARGDIADLGGIEVAVGAMNLHKWVPLQEEACLLLKEMTANDSLEHSTRIGDMGGVDSIMTAMGENMAAKSLLEHGCWALRHLAHNNDINKHRIADKNGIEVITGAMSKHKGSVVLQEQGCWVVLYVSAASVAISEDMAKKGAISSVVAAIRGHPAAEGVQAQGAWALANLAQNCPGNCKRLLEAGGLEVMVEAMKRHPRSLNVQAKTTRAFARAAKFFNPACARIRELGGVDLVMEAMRAHKSSPTLQQEGTLFLKTMANQFLKTMGLASANTAVAGVSFSNETR